MTVVWIVWCDIENEPMKVFINEEKARKYVEKLRNAPCKGEHKLMRMLVQQ